MSFFSSGRGKPSARPKSHLSRRSWLRLERIEDRIAPAVFTIANGDIAALRAAITTSNTNNEPDVINLAAGGFYNFTNVAAAETALPVIQSDNADPLNTLTINGNGATLNRNAGAPLFRFLTAQSSTTPADLTVNDLTMNGGLTTGSGGAVFLSGSIGTLVNCKITNNSAENGGGLVSVSTTNVSLTLTNCEFAGNVATGGTGAGVGGGIAVQGTVTTTFTGLKVLDNQSNNNGAGVWVQGANLTMIDSIVKDNRGITPQPAGGGIFVNGDLVFTNGQVANNSSFAGGGGIYVIGNATISNASVTGNTATSPLGAGGGLFVQGDMSITNSTFDGNSAGAGGGIAQIGTQSGSTQSTVIEHATITRNSVFSETAIGGGVFLTINTVATIANTIIAENIFQGSVTAGQGADIFATVGQMRYSLIGNDDGALTLNGPPAAYVGNQIGKPGAVINPLLGELGEFGGNSLTRTLLPGSPALDAGDPNFLSPPDFDQRGDGFPRAIGRLDIGALEASQVDLFIIKTNNINSAIPGEVVTYTVIVGNMGPQDAIGAKVRDTFSSEFTNITWTANFENGATGNATGSGAILETVNIPVGGIITYTVSATISPSATGNLSNTAFIDPPGGYADPAPDDNSSTDIDVLTPIADGYVTMSMAGTPTPGNTVVFTITVGNNGPSSVSNQRLINTFSGIFSVVNWTSLASGGASGNAPIGSGSIDQFLTLAPGSIIVYTVEATINPDVPAGTLINTATITPPDSVADPNTDNNSAAISTDLLVGRQLLVVGADAGALPQVNVYNPLSGTLRQSIMAYSSSFRGGVRVATGDVNGDGVLDIITAPGVGGGPHVKVFDGATGVLMWEFFAYDAGFSGGVYVAAGDVNGDGLADVITGAGAGGGPHVKVYDAATRNVMAGPIGEFFAYDPGFTGGVRLATGDFNLDGRADIVTGAGKGGGPHVRVFDGMSRTELLGFFAYDPRFTGGVYVTAADFTGDGVADVITGAGEGGGPHVRFFDGTNGLIFREFFAYPASTGSFGANSVWASGVRVAALGDVTGDGFPDLYVAPGSGRTSSIRLFSGATLAIARVTQVFDPSFLGGVFVGTA